ncbi:putative Ig domain-containing protein, partial [bacterium]|nr:putative Ig domain-containing protein [bacterium]
PDAAGVSLNSATGSFIWMPTNTEAGVYRFTFTVTDNGIQPKSDSKTVTITVFGTYEAQLSHVPSGPSYASVEIPENGNGYSYFYFMSEGGKVYHGENINLKLLRSESQIVDITGDFIEEGILRIILPASEMGGAATAAFTMPDTIKFGGSLFVITNSPITFNAQLTPCEYFRVWNIYGSGSAGVTGTIGSGGVSATVSAAKLSVKGQGGLGLKIERDEESNITLERRMETDFSIRTELPSVNYIVGGVEIGEKGLDSKTLIGQKFRFADAIYNDDVKNIAQTGFILEALSFGGAELSPIAGSIIKASINTLNSTGNVNTYFNDGLVENYWGLGAEGSARSSSSIDVGENFKLKFAENVSGYAVHSKYFTGTRQLTDGIGKLSNWYNIHNGDGRELIQASNFNFADYNLDFTYDDKVELNLDNFGLFDNNTGSEIFYSLNLGSSPNTEKLYVKMTGGGNTPLFGSQKETYYGTA